MTVPLLQLPRVAPLAGADVSVVVPAYNEEDNIDLAVERIKTALEGLTDNYEIIVIDDGSEDGTHKRVRHKNGKDSRVKVLRHGVNMGKGFAIKHAAEIATGSRVAIVDSDMEIDPRQLRLYLDMLDSYDISIASKRHKYSSYKAPFTRKFFSLGFNLLVRLLTGLQVSDTQAGLKCIRGEYFRTVVDSIVVKRYAYDVEMLAVARALKLKVIELPIVVDQRSAFRPMEAIQMFRDLLGIAYRLRVTKWYQRRLSLELRKKS